MDTIGEFLPGFTGYVWFDEKVRLVILIVLRGGAHDPVGPVSIPDERSMPLG